MLRCLTNCRIIIIIIIIIIDLKSDALLSVTLSNKLVNEFIKRQKSKIESEALGW